MDLEIMTNCFPKSLMADVESVYADLNFKSCHGEVAVFSVNLEKQQLFIPQRIYCEQSQLEKVSKMSATQQLIVFCFYSRHHNGYVRERCLQQIISSQQSFVIPFILQLLGEYVIEIIARIFSNREKLCKSKFKAFIVENPRFYELTCQRVMSYWNCYYCNIYPKKPARLEADKLTIADYPGVKMKQYIEREIINKKDK